LFQLNAEVMTFEYAPSHGRDPPRFADYKTDKKIGIGVVNHCIATGEPAECGSLLIRKAARIHAV
jgi:5-methyltetrahydropteroyltriglutamate--homocysteine methyltransferase